MAFLVAGCSIADSEATSTVPAEGIYISIGDSYAAGSQPARSGRLETTRNGFAYLIESRVAAAGGHLKLLNFGCSGATSTSVLTHVGCDQAALGPAAAPYSTSTQIDAVVAAISQNRSKVRLITIVIGGNDINACLPPSSVELTDGDAACLEAAIVTLSANLRELLGRIRGVAGPEIQILGLTYPNFYLGAWLLGNDAAKKLAEASIPFFRDRLNPLLQDEYTRAQASFADITEASGGYGPFGPTTDMTPYGVIPTPVAQICTLTNYCALGDPHPTDEGYEFIADQVMKATQLT